MADICLFINDNLLGNTIWIRWCSYWWCYWKLRERERERASSAASASFIMLSGFVPTHGHLYVSVYSSTYSHQVVPLLWFASLVQTVQALASVLLGVKPKISIHLLIHRSDLTSHFFSLSIANIATLFCAAASSFCTSTSATNLSSSF